MFIAGILAALPAPRYWWVAVIGIFSGERIYMFVMMPENRGWLLFSIYMGLLTLTWLPTEKRPAPPDPHRCTDRWAGCAGRS